MPSFYIYILISVGSLKKENERVMFTNAMLFKTNAPILKRIQTLLSLYNYTDEIKLADIAPVFRNPKATENVVLYTAMSFLYVFDIMAYFIEFFKISSCDGYRTRRNWDGESVCGATKKSKRF